MKKSTEQKNTTVAVSVRNLNKKFIIPHEKIQTLRGMFVHMMKKRTHDVLHALDDISFDVYQGEFFAIMGRNGSGKSTLLKILAGVYEQDSGSVIVSGGISPFLELGIGFHGELSGRDNIYLNATVLGLSKKEIDEKIDAIINFSELERFIDQKVKNYSSGMYMRLAFSVAIHANKEVLLMDEVLAVGDAPFQEKCLAELRRLKRMGKTIILVSHGEQSVRDFADRVLILDHGRMHIIDTAAKSLFAYQKLLMQEQQDETVSDTKKKKNSIVDVRLYNDRNIETSVFESRETIRIEINYDIKDISQQLHVGLGILDKKTDAWVCGNNTLYETYQHPWKKGKNRIVLTFPEALFHKGEFVINTSLFSEKENGEQVFYDMYLGSEHQAYFKVIPGDKRNGLVHMPHRWSE
ncbi:MAG: ABC transporter ATP-binding protein [Candidatus Pacebacteria bacterium]|nr:ABC transporter ATP-binding protein [Candidatus Paceibacterota bacterium]